MGSRPGWIDAFWRGVPIGILGDHRPTGLHVDTGGPVDVRITLGRQKLAVLAVENVKKSVLVRLQDDLMRCAPHVEVGEDHFLYRVEIPTVAWRGLVVPRQSTGLRMQCDDRCRVERVEPGLA